MKMTEQTLQERCEDLRHLTKSYQSEANYYKEKASKWEKQSKQDEIERERLTDLLVKIFDLTAYDQKETVDNLTKKLDRIRKLTKEA